MIKAYSDIFKDALYFEFSRSLETSVFVQGSVGIKPNLSKVFERRIYHGVVQLFDKILSKHQCGFRQGHSAQHFLIVHLKM